VSQPPLFGFLGWSQAGDNMGTTLKNTCGIARSAVVKLLVDVFFFLRSQVGRNFEFLRFFDPPKSVLDLRMH